VVDAYDAAGVQQWARLFYRPPQRAGEEAGHQELVAEFHLVHIGVRPRTPRRRKLMSASEVGRQSISSKRGLVHAPFSAAAVGR
jgi:hypothetical protein